MARDGADIIDVGGESTRPGAPSITEGEEIARVLPVVDRLSRLVNVPISIDTRKARVAEAAIKAGASIVNNVAGIAHDPEMTDVVAKYGAGLIIMHMKGAPQTMQARPAYKDVMREIVKDIRKAIRMAKRSGVSQARIIIDPGIGFGKTAAHNLEILNRLDELKTLGRPICVGTSRKSFIGKVLKIDNPIERSAGTLATCAIAIMKGANIIRVHDVKQACQVARITDAVLAEKIV
jgi:dihydropteroate synthase